MKASKIEMKGRFRIYDKVNGTLEFTEITKEGEEFKDPFFSWLAGHGYLYTNKGILCKVTIEPLEEIKELNES